MRVLCILLIIKLLSSAVDCVGIKWSQIQPEPGNLTSIKSTSVANQILSSLGTTKNFFAQYHNEILGIANVATLATAAVPVVPTVISVTASFASMLETQSEWKEQFAVVIANVLQASEAKGFLSLSENKLITSKNSFFPFMEQVLEEMDKKEKGEIAQVDEKRIEAVERELHGLISTFSDIINAFTKPQSVFKTNALIGAPFLIELSLLISVLEPIAMNFTALASAYKVSCQIRDALTDYMPFVVGARLDKLNAPLEIMKEVRREIITRNDPLEESSVLCNSDCSGETNCLIDSFGTKRLGKDNNHDCEKSYARHLRYRVEKMFPIEQLDVTCNRTIGRPDGFGWATIKLKKLHATHLEDPIRGEYSFSRSPVRYSVRNTCDGHAKGEDSNQKCDPFVEVRVKGEEVLTTVKREDTEDFDVFESVTSGLIHIEHTKIEITVYDHNTNRAHEVLLRTEGPVDFFMKNPLQCTPDVNAKSLGSELHVEGNCLEIDVIWQPRRTLLPKTEPLPIPKPYCKLSSQPDFGGKTEDGVYFDGGYVQLMDRFVVGPNVEISFDIKPRTLNGQLFSVYGPRAMFVLELIDGSLNLTMNNGDGPHYALSTWHFDGKNLCDGEWHTVTAVKSQYVIKLIVDGVDSSPTIGSTTSISTETTRPLFFGGHPNFDLHKDISVRTPFIGCMRNIKIRNVAHPISSTVAHGQVHVGGCPLN